MCRFSGLQRAATASIDRGIPMASSSIGGIVVVIVAVIAALYANSAGSGDGSSASELVAMASRKMKMTPTAALTHLEEVSNTQLQCPLTMCFARHS